MESEVIELYWKWCALTIQAQRLRQQKHAAGNMLSALEWNGAACFGSLFLEELEAILWPGGDE